CRQQKTAPRSGLLPSFWIPDSPIPSVTQDWSGRRLPRRGCPSPTDNRPISTSIGAASMSRGPRRSPSAVRQPCHVKSANARGAALKDRESLTRHFPPLFSAALTFLLGFRRLMIHGFIVEAQRVGALGGFFIMSIDFIRPEVDELRPRISVIGVGGAGGNAIANMMNADVQGVDFIVANTDAQALNHSTADRRIQLGLKITQGLGAGSRPEIGRAAAEETIDEILQALEGAHMCFIAAGMGGGTGTGAAPVIAKAARDKGILTVGVCTKPFAFEGSRRGRSADAGIAELQQHVDTLIVIPNQNLFRLANSETTFKQAFEMADEVLQQGVRGITDLMVMPGLINLDFADVRSVMSEMGKAMMGTGEADGDNRAIEAAEKAISNPLLDGVSMKGAKGVIISITGGEDMRLMEVDE